MKLLDTCQFSSIEINHLFQQWKHLFQYQKNKTICFPYKITLRWSRCIHFFKLISNKSNVFIMKTFTTFTRIQQLHKPVVSQEKIKLHSFLFLCFLLNTICPFYLTDQFDCSVLKPSQVQYRSTGLIQENQANIAQ